MATVDLSRNARYGDDVRTEILGSNGALLVDLLPTSRTRLGDAGGMRELPSSMVEDAMAAGVAAQAVAFAEAIAGGDVDVPLADCSVRATRYRLRRHRGRVHRPARSTLDARGVLTARLTWRSRRGPAGHRRERRRPAARTPRRPTPRPGPHVRGWSPTPPPSRLPS